jgi:hypothetical protein
MSAAAGVEKLPKSSSQEITSAAFSNPSWKFRVQLLFQPFLVGRFVARRPRE